MINVFFNSEVLTAEKKICSALKIPTIVLMENAGSNAAGYIINHYKNQLKYEIIIVTGKGNNAGDGFVIARHLTNKNKKVKVLTLFREKELKDDALVNYSVLKNQNDENLKIVYCSDAKELKKEIQEDNKIIIDAIFGVGFKGKPDNRIKDIFDQLNKLNEKIIISIDTPSGLYRYDQDTPAVKANLTLTMGVKKFHSLFYKGREYTGKYKVAEIGISDSEFTVHNSRKIFEIEEKDIRMILPLRNINSNKYSSGKVLILSGSVGLTGASYLCSMSALRTGSGAVITGVPESLNSIMETKMTEVMTIPLSETKEKTLSLNCYDLVKKRIEWADTVLIGPGISKNEETMELVRKIVKDNNVNFVIDADAVSAFRGKLNLLKNKKIILTPHFGEFANLTGISTEELKSNFFEYAYSFAKEHRLILVLKNSPTIITDGDGFYINSTGKENLATAGTGDVLSGIISSLYSTGKNILSSAIAGVYIHGKCGDKLYSKDGSSSTIAGDLINIIPEVKQELSCIDN